MKHSPAHRWSSVNVSVKWYTKMGTNIVGVITSCRIINWPTNMTSWPMRLAPANRSLQQAQIPRQDAS